MAETTEREKGGKEEGGAGRKVKGCNTESVGVETATLSEKTQDYFFYRSLNLCPKCRNPVNDRAYCTSCTKKKTATTANWRVANRKKYLKQQVRHSKRKRDKRLENNRCGDCGKEPIFTLTLGRKCLAKMRARNRKPNAEKRTCRLCKGTQLPDHRNRLGCPLRFRVSVDEYATMRPGSDHPDSAIGLDTRTGKWKRKRDERKKKEHVNRSKQFSGDRPSVGDCGGPRSEVGSHPEG